MFRYFNKVQRMHRLFYVNPNFTRLMVEQQKPSFQAVRVNNFSTSKTVFQISAAEENLIKMLSTAFPKATDIAVVDVSGGCGSMYEVHIEAPDFAGMRTVKQHQLVTKALSTQIKDMHGIRISTTVSPSGCGGGQK